MSFDRSSISMRCATAPASRSDMDGPAQRLRATAGIQRVPTRELDLFIVKRFLDEETCAAVIDRIDAKRRPSTIADDSGVASFRTSETCDLDPSDPLVADVDRKFCDL